jgi:hypothetical protein
MTEIDKTRITVQIWEKLAEALEKNLAKLFIKRDLYLNELFKLEIEKLAIEVVIPNTDKAFEMLKKSSKTLRRDKLNILMDKKVAIRIDEVLSEKNIPRDCFFNRVIYYLCIKNPDLIRDDQDYDDLEIDFENEIKSFAKERCFTIAELYLLNPFVNMRHHNDGKFYTIENFPHHPDRKDSPALFSFNTCCSEVSLKDLLGFN